MGSSSRSRSSGPVLPVSSGFGRYAAPQPSAAPPPSSSYAFASSSAASFTSSSFTSSSIFSSHRSSSPTRVYLVSSPQPSHSVRFSLDCGPTSPRGSLSAFNSAPSQIATKKPRPPAGERRTCMCSPTTHPGSFRCSLHKGFSGGGGGGAVSSSSNRLNARRSAMTNSLVRIGTVEGDWVKRALSALIRPSSHQQRRRAGFQPRPSRLSNMSVATNNDIRV